MSRLMLMMFVFSCVAVVMSSLYSRSLVGFLMSEMEDNIETRLKETSKRGAELVTVEELETYQKPEDMELPGYQTLRRKLRVFAPDAGVLYIYYLRSVNESGDKMQFIVDNDFDEATRVGLDTPPSDVALVPGLKGALEGRVESASLGSYMVGWEGLLSAYTPMLDAEGRVAAVCGVDINDEMIISTQRRENLLRTLEMVAIAVVLLSGALSLANYSNEARFARDANIFKSKFLSRFGHEMRSPLSAMSANAALAEDLLAGETELTDNAEKILAALHSLKEEADRLGRMSGAAVTLGVEQSSFKQRREKEKKIRLDIARLLDTVCEIYRPMIERRGNRLVTNIFKDGSSPGPNGNPDELSEVLINFISNANEHTRDGEIQVTASVNVGLITIEVTDNGKGIEPDVLPRIFERRPYKSASGRTGGIGLSICRDIVEDHGGQIGIESEPGEGTRIFFSIPAAESAEGE